MTIKTLRARHPRFIETSKSESMPI